MSKLANCLWILLFLAAAIAVPPSAQGEPRGYLYQYKNKAGKIKAIVFDGDAEWLAKQGDPRSHLHELPHLERLTLRQHRISLAEMNYIMGLKKLKWLDVGEPAGGFPEEEVEITGDLLALVGRMTWLEDFRVDTSRLEEKDWAFLPKLKSLKSLMTGKRLPPKDSFLGYVAECKTLESLDVRGPTQFSSEALARLGTLRKLKVLSIYSHEWTDDQVKVLAGLSDLEELQLGGKKLTAKSIEHLRPLHKLRELSLPLEGLPRPAMETIAGLKHLEKLSLFAAKIGDEEIAALQDHPTLKTLFLDSAKVTERSLPVLRSLKRLEHASLRGDEESRKIEEAVNKKPNKRFP